jgi:hypothetical protein
VSAVRTGTSLRLFAGVYPAGIVYADRARERGGDYLKLAFLPFRSLVLEWEGVSMPDELRAEITRDAERIAERRGQDFQVSTSGQVVRLGQ